MKTRIGLIPDGLLYWEKTRVPMNYAFAIKEFEALNGEIDEVRRDDLTLLVQDSASSLIQKFDILLKNFYPTVDDFGNTQFTPSLNGIAINNYSTDQVISDKTKLNRLQGLIENILVDLRLKETLANEKVKDNKLRSDFQLATAQNRESRAVLAEKVEELNAVNNTKQHEIDVVTNHYQNRIDAIKDKYQTEIDKLRNAPTGFNYKIGFYLILFALLSLLTFGVPYMLESMNWKYIIGIELAIIASILIFYFKNVPGWVQFLVATVLAILAIFFT
jgi:hypothetical protein